MSAHALAPEAAPPAPARRDAGLLRLTDLTVGAPDGRTLLDGVDLELKAGEAVVVVGPSGAGKSTLLRALFEPHALRAEGYEVALGRLASKVAPGLVPQHGAPFDHLDVAGNIALAIRHAPAGLAGTVEAALAAVDLDPGLGQRPATQLSGGQAQRLAIARALASGRRVLFFDEPSVGLDPPRVAGLAAGLRSLCDDSDAAVVVVTHDTAFAGLFADRALALDAGGLAAVSLPPRGADGCRGDAGARGAQAALDGAIASVAAPAETGRRRPGLGRRLRGWVGAHLAPFGVAVTAPPSFAAAVARHPGDALGITARALRQALLRPLLFYFVVAFLLGLTVLYVLTTFGGEVGPEEALRIVRSLPLLALTPPLAAFFFVATSANAVNAWLGGMKLSRQVTALEALGVRRSRYLFGPSWFALALSLIVVAAVFAAGFLLGELALAHLLGLEDAVDVLTADLLDPAPERAPYRLRAVGLVLVYAVGCASDTIARADEPKPDADSVTRAMTRSVVACTLWVVAWELVSLLILQASRGAA